MEEKLKEIVEKIFNNWTGLRLAVEHGMGGRNGHKTAIEIMDYMYEYCIRNTNVSQSELQEVLEDLMDQEFSTVCEDNSIPEICCHLVKFLSLCQANNAQEIEIELSKLPDIAYWLRPGAQITYKRVDGDSSSSDDDSESGAEDMEVDEFATSASATTSKRNQEQTEVDPGWTLVKKRK